MNPCKSCGAHPGEKHKSSCYASSLPLDDDPEFDDFLMDVLDEEDPLEEEDSE